MDFLDDLINETIKETTPIKEGPKKEGPPLVLADLLLLDLYNDDIKQQIYNIFRADIELFIDNYLLTSKDVNADQGLYKCSLETWEALCTDIGLYYFRKNKYLLDKKKIAAAGGVALSDELLSIGLELYEYFCMKYKKQFFIYDCCRFLGIDKDLMFKLNILHSQLLKKAHAGQEASLRAGLASGRSNVTGLAILLNHDYDYTRTTQIIHTTGPQELAADKLPELPSNRNNDNIIDVSGADLL